MIPPTIVFPSEPFDEKRVCEAFNQEFEAATSAGFYTALVDDSEELARSVARIKGYGNALYRGWMLSLEDYETVYNGLRENGLTLVNNSMSYFKCHYLPEAYHVIKDYTPRTVWSACGPNPSELTLHSLWTRLDAPAAILKDYVKSEKHYWHEACYVPNETALSRVVANFISLRGPLFTGGLVLREFIPGLQHEIRTFWHDQRMIHHTVDLKFLETHAFPEWLSRIASRISSRFFTIDLAMTQEGEWIILEVGDGQVSGIPYGVVPFYKALFEQYEAIQLGADLWAKRNERNAASFVAGWLDNRLLQGRFGLCNQALAYINTKETPAKVLQAILFVTLRYKDNLPNRTSFRNRVELVLAASGNHGLLEGL